MIDSYKQDIPSFASLLFSIGRMRIPKENQTEIQIDLIIIFLDLKFSFDFKLLLKTRIFYNYITYVFH